MWFGEKIQNCPGKPCENIITTALLNIHSAYLLLAMYFQNIEFLFSLSEAVHVITIFVFVCRIHGDRSFHCDVCGVCLDVQLRGNHKCREGSAHDECCICLEVGRGGN